MTKIFHQDASPTGQTVTCPKCSGSGTTTTRITTTSWPGNTPVTQTTSCTCSYCDGSGRVSR